MDELVASIAGGRPAAADRGPPGGRGPVRAGDGGASLAGGPAGRPGDHSGHRPGDQGPQPAAGRPAGEPASGPAQPARGGGGVPADAGGLRLHPGGAGQPDQALPTADLQHDPAAPAAAGRAAPGRRRRAQRRSRPGPAGDRQCRPSRSAWLSGWSPRACRSGPSRSWSRSARPAQHRRRSAGRGNESWLLRPTRPPIRLTDYLDTRVRVEMGRSKGRIVIDFATAEDLDRIVSLIVRGQSS